MISVIIPVYNVEAQLNRCLESVKNQTYKDLEVILIDDGSTDNSGNICDQYSKIDKRFKTIHKKNEGVPSARNDGLKVASGQYIAFVDSDDYIELDMFSYLYDLICKYDADFSCCGVNRIFEKNGVPYRTEITSCGKDVIILDQEGAFESYQLYNGITPSIWNKLFKKEVFTNVRFEYIRRFDDVRTMCDCIAESHRIVCGNEPKYNYVIRKTSITYSAFSDKSYDILYAVNKNYEVFKHRYPNNKNAELGKIHHYMIFANELIVKNGSDDEFIKHFRKYIKENAIYVIRDEKIGVTRKVEFLLYAYAYGIYKLVYKLYMNFTGK